MNTNMTPAERALHLRRDRLEHELESVATRLDIIHKFGTDDYENGAVIRFDKRFKPDGQSYAYVAIKSDGNWYVSGPTNAGKAYTWDELLAWLANGQQPTVEVWLVENYVAVA